MKLEELLNAVDSGVVEEITIFYCGGCIKIEPNNAPFELPDYPISKIWQSENGRGLSVLLADNITKDERGASESVNTENAKKAADTLRKYCDGFNVCSKNCIFYREGLPCCALKFPYEYDIKEETQGGGKA